MANKYYYKLSKVKGQTYLQIWERKESKDKMVQHCGSAKKLHNKLVRLKNIEDDVQR